MTAFDNKNWIYAERHTVGGGREQFRIDPADVEANINIPSGSGITWLGTFNPLVIYIAGDAVAYLGSSYLALTTTSQVPPGSDWDILASKGDTGATGATGADGATGPAGAPQTPSATVADLDGTGAAGSSANYSRGDHRHADTNRPSDGQKAALAGTSGTPSVTNKYVTDADSRNSDARTAAAHNLLSAIHGDTTVGSATRGDLIYADSTPKWTRRAVGTGVLVANGTDVTGWTQNPTLATPVVNTLLDLAAGQIKFPATQVGSSDANTLDDYEEGSFTFTVGGATSESGQVYSQQFGRYVKIGRWVFIQAYLQLSTLGTITGAVVLKGLPFASSNTANFFQNMKVDWGGMTSTYVAFTGEFNPNTSQVVLYGKNAAAATIYGGIAQADLAATSNFALSGAYYTDAT